MHRLGIEPLPERATFSKNFCLASGRVTPPADTPLKKAGEKAGSIIIDAVDSQAQNNKQNQNGLQKIMPQGGEQLSGFRRAQNNIAK